MPSSLKYNRTIQLDQLSFIGGKPRLPTGKHVPRCLLCNSSLTFFFQFALTRGGLWEGYTLAVYQCTKCAHEDHLIPEMVESAFAGTDIQESFFTRYQSNFAFIVYPTNEGEIVSSYEESIVFSEIVTVEGESVGSFGKVGGLPTWILDDESPATYMRSVQMKFLLQVVPNFQFKMTNNAEPQIELDLMGDAAPSPLDYYQLFIGNALYFFGTECGDKKVYAITQV
jgi:hypothetical protein